MFVTAAVLALFAACMVVAYWWDDKQQFGSLVETVKYLIVGVVFFWVGSSLGSKQQSETIAAKLSEHGGPSR